MYNTYSSVSTTTYYSLIIKNSKFEKKDYFSNQVIVETLMYSDAVTIRFCFFLGYGSTMLDCIG